MKWFLIIFRKSIYYKKKAISEKGHALQNVSGVKDTTTGMLFFCHFNIPLVPVQDFLVSDPYFFCP